MWEVLQRKVKFKYPHAHSRGQETVPLPAWLRTGIPHQGQLAGTFATTLWVEVSFSLIFTIRSQSSQIAGTSHAVDAASAFTEKSFSDVTKPNVLDQSL